MNPDETVWDIYFASLAGWIYHPGRYREGTPELSLEQIALCADEMLNIRRKRWPDGQLQQK